MEASSALCTLSTARRMPVTVWRRRCATLMASLCSGDLGTPDSCSEMSLAVSYTPPPHDISIPEQETF